MALHNEEDLNLSETGKDTIENNQYFELLKDEVLMGDSIALYALNKVHLVAYELGPTLSRDHLVPFLASVQETADMTTLNVLCDAWYTLSKYVGDGSNLVPIINAIEFLLTQEDPSIRSHAIDVLIKIVEDQLSKENLDDDSEKFDLVDTVICPMIKKLASSEWFAGATSACFLIPKLYKHASESCQAELRQNFQQLCETDMLTVKLAAAKNLKTVITIVELEHAISMFWLVLKNMSVESQDDVRSHAVESCLEFAKRSTPAQNLHFNYPILKAAAEDSSLKIREFVARLFQKVYETFGEDEVRTHLLDKHLSLLNDANDNVKLAAIESFSGWSGILSLELIELYIPILDELAKKSHRDNRRNVCKVLALFAMKLKKEDARRIVYPTMIHLFEDQLMDVRLCVVQNIHLICNREEFHGIIGEKLIETVRMVLDNPQWRHRLIIAEQLISFFSHFGAGIFEEFFLTALFVLLLDNVWKVRNAVLISLEKICNESGSIWALKFILRELLIIYFNPEKSQYIKGQNIPLSYSFKIIIIQALVAVSKSIDVETTINHVVPLLIKATMDPIPNIRFVAANALSNLFIIYKNENPELFLQAKCALIKLCQDCDIDVKYFSKKALDAYDESFRSGNDL